MNEAAIYLTWFDLSNIFLSFFIGFFLAIYVMYKKHEYFLMSLSDETLISIQKDMGIDGE